MKGPGNGHFSDALALLLTPTRACFQILYKSDTSYWGRLHLESGKMLREKL